MNAVDAGIKAGLMISAFLAAEKGGPAVTVGVVKTTETSDLAILLQQEGSDVVFWFDANFARMVAGMWTIPEAPWNVNHWTENSEEYAGIFTDAADKFDEVAARGECKPFGVKLN